MSNKLTKKEIALYLCKKNRIDRFEAIELINSVFNCIVEGLGQGKTAELRGLGTFEIRKRKGKTNARNPKTGKQVVVKPHCVVFFRSGKILQRKMLNLCLEK